MKLPGKHALDELFVCCLTGMNCSKEIDVCESDPCQNGGTCVEGIGNYSCLCVTEIVDLRVYGGNTYEYGLSVDLFISVRELLISKNCHM